MGIIIISYHCVMEEEIFKEYDQGFIDPYEKNLDSSKIYVYGSVKPLNETDFFVEIEPFNEIRDIVKAKRKREKIARIYKIPINEIFIYKRTLEEVSG